MRWSPSADAHALCNGFRPSLARSAFAALRKTVFQMKSFAHQVSAFIHFGMRCQGIAIDGCAREGSICTE